MNFHKTIGYLAALLLVLGLGVPDSFAQDVSTLSLTVNPRTLRDSTAANGGVVTVTARLTVTLAENVPDDDDDGNVATRDVTVAIAISADETEGNLSAVDDSYTVSGGGNETVMVDEGKNRGTAMVLLEFTLSHDDDSFDEEATVTATIAGANAVDGGDGDDDITKMATVDVIDYSASLTRNAVSARGMQVFLTAPTGANPVGAGKNKIKVEVRRKGGLGSEFGAFTSIKVALRNRNAKGDEDDPEEDLYSLTITDAVQLGTLILPRIRSGDVTGDAVGNSGLTPPTTLDADDTKASYKRRSSSEGYDVLEFLFHPTGGGAYDKLYAVATFNADEDLTISSLDTDTSIYPPDPTSFPNQVVGNGETGKLDAGLPLNTIVTAITIEIDDGDPVDSGADAIQSALLAAGHTAGIGQTIKITVSITDFGERTLGFEIIGRDGKSFEDEDGDRVWVTAGANVTPTGNNEVRLEPQVITGHTFPDMGALEVLREVSQGKPVVVEVPVKRAGQFMRKANLAKHPDGDFGKNKFYEDDDVVVQVRAFVKDLAGNKTGQEVLSLPFILDSRPPKVTITYPKPSAPDSTRFTAEVSQEYSFLDGGDTVELKPLNFKIDESTTAIYVVIDEDTLTVSEDLIEISTDELDDGYNLADVDIYPLKNPDDPEENKHPVEDSEQGGAAVKLQVVAKDRVGNEGVGTPDGGDATFDAKAPEVEIIFPTNDALEEALGNKIGGVDRTQDPIFRVNEATDSILVRYVSNERTLDVVLADGSSKKDQNIVVSFLGDEELVEGEAYDLQVYVRDLTGYVGISDSDSDSDGSQPEEDLIFEEDLANPQASDFAIVSEVRDSSVDPDADDVEEADIEKSFAEEDSVVAGQAMRLTITASDAMLSDRAAVAYRKDVTVIAMDSDDNAVSSASFWGTGVMDNEDGSATLDGDSWNVGVFGGVFLRATKAGDYTIAVKELDDAGVAVVTGTATAYVRAANFDGFNIAILENNAPVDDIRGAFQLGVAPADEFGNVSVKVYKDPAEDAKIDSLDLLDSRMPEETTLRYADGVDATFSSWPVLTQLPPPIFPLPVPEGGRTFGIPEAPAGETLWIHVAVVNGNLNSEDTQSKDRSSSKTFNILSALSPVLTLWGPGGEDWTDETEIAIPADAGEITVTVVAEGYAANSAVTFTKNGTESEGEAGDGGNAPLMVTVTEAGDLTVSATDGRFDTGESSWTFVTEPAELMRQEFSDADGPVYIINLADPTMTVGSDDYALFLAAWGSSKGEDNYNIQADINEDETVNSSDYALFLTSWGKTATGPASKPIVLLPGVNENAEFSLSLGSERVVAGELVAVDVSLANVAALVAYGFTLNYETDNFEFVSVAPADEDLLKSTGGDTPLFHHIVTDGQVEVVNGMVNGSAVSGGGDIVRFVFRVLREFEDNARFEIADGLVFDPSQLSNPAVVAGVLELQSTPREFALHQNFPNPFNPDTTIKYDLAESADVTLQIYNVLGQVVRTLVGSEAQNAGRYQIRWNGMDDRGVSVSSGIYFYQISAEGKFQNVRKLMMLK